MKHFIHIALFAGLSALGIAQAQAAASDLSKCYDKVIAACNKTNHSQSCTESGMNQCDKVYPAPLVFKPTLGLAAQAKDD